MQELYPGFFSSSLLFLRGAIIVGLLLYAIFSLVILKQVFLMSETIDVGFVRPIKFLATLHLIATLFILVFALFI